MEKVISIDGRDVRFRSTAALPLIYSKHFGSDLLRDTLNMQDDRLANTTLMFRMLWTMAYCADRSIKPIEQWLDGFETFPIYRVFQELNGMFWGSIRNVPEGTDPTKVTTP